MSRRSERSIIINADDLGLSTTVNADIFSLMEADLVTSATAMANGDAIDAAVEGARKFPANSFGVHLNITQGVPLRPSDALRPILDASGKFTPRIFEAPIDDRLRNAIADEWSAQVEHLRARGLRISHLDSHEHVHTIPRLFNAFKLVQRRFGIRRARLTKNLYCRDLPAGSRVLAYKKAAWNAALKLSYRTRTTDWFSDFYTFNRAVFERPIGHGIVEAMVHPGAVGDPIMETELAELRAGALRRMPFPVRLISYNDL